MKRQPRAISWREGHYYGGWLVDLCSPVILVVHSLLVYLEMQLQLVLPSSLTNGRYGIVFILWGMVLYGKVWL